MNQHIDPIQFNALLAQIDAATDEQMHAELKAAYERISELEAALQKCEGHFTDANFGKTEDQCELVMLNIVRNALCQKVQS